MQNLIEVAKYINWSIDKVLSISVPFLDGITIKVFFVGIFIFIIVSKLVKSQIYQENSNNESNIKINEKRRNDDI